MRLWLVCGLGAIVLALVVIWIFRGLSDAANVAAVISVFIAVVPILLSLLPLPSRDREPSRLRATLLPIQQWLRRRRGRIAVLLVAVAVPIAGIVVLIQILDDGPGADLLTRVPDRLSGDCDQLATPAEVAASATLSCTPADGPEVVINLFDSAPTLDAAYAHTVGRADIPRGSGDCAKATDAEHRYPAVGALAGRVLCYRQDGVTFLVWTDDAARTMVRASRRDGNDAALYEFWAALVGVPAFPTPQERSLLDMVPKSDCRRVPAGSLDSFPGVVAAIECDPEGAEADKVFYYRFANLDNLRRSYDSHVRAAGAPQDVYCLDGKAPGGLGEDVHDLRSVTLGRILCHPGEAGGSVIEWTVEPLLILGSAVGADYVALGQWWRDDRGPLNSAIAEAVNAQSEPPFPTPDERELLARIPAASRVDCMRPSGRQIATNLPGSPVTAIVCGPTEGAGIVFYYQLPDDVSMDAGYRNNVPSADSPAQDCAGLPMDFVGDAPYSRAGVVTGRLGCAQNNAGPYLVWTNDQLKILVLAFYGTEPATLLGWWRDEAGPV